MGYNRAEMTDSCSDNLGDFGGSGNSVAVRDSRRIPNTAYAPNTPHTAGTGASTPSSLAPSSSLSTVSQVAAEDEQNVALTSTYRLLQPRKGHRYSVDDMLVGHLAITWATSRGIVPRRVLDLGTGLGSVLLMIAWRFEHATFVGVEAQETHVAWAKRSVELNACTQRVRIVHGDLRDDVLMQTLGCDFDLVTATPPYFDPDKTTVCANERRAYAQWELRGGIEQYACAAAHRMAPNALFVTCSAAMPKQRTPQALASCGLQPLWCRQVVPRQGREPFLTLWVAMKSSSPSAAHDAINALDNLDNIDKIGENARENDVVYAPDLVLRLDDGARSQEHIAIRQSFGIPCTSR